VFFGSITNSKVGSKSHRLPTFFYTNDTNLFCIGAKEKDYDPHLKTSTLQPVWISQSSSKQRKGRAGRTKAGVCFHLFSSTRHQSMRPFVESELLRTPLVSFIGYAAMLHVFIVVY
jgi:HrpA-like RNA helicase